MNSFGTLDSSAAALLLVLLAVPALLALAGTWRVYAKAGKNGFASLIPIYSTYILLKIVGRPGWWLPAGAGLALIPYVGVIPVLAGLVVVNHDLSKSFGKGVGFTVFLTLLPAIALPVLGFGRARYLGPAAAPAFKER